MSTSWAYLRVSSTDQNLDRQREAMHKAGIEDRLMFEDKQSGEDFARPAYQRMLRRLRPGDTVFVKSLDRLGRNYDEILEQWRLITKKKQADIVVLDMPLLDTRQSKDLMGKVIADIVLQLLSYVAQTEREMIRQRQAEGIAAAKARGVKFGRQGLPKPDDFAAIVAEHREGKISSRAAGKRLGVSHKTFLKWEKEARE